MPQVTRFFRTLERLSSWRQALSHFETCLENSSTTIIFKKFYFYDNDRFFGSNLRPRRSSFEISGRSWAICHHFPLFFLLEIRSPPINISRISMTFEKNHPRRLQWCWWFLNVSNRTYTVYDIHLNRSPTS